MLNLLLTFASFPLSLINAIFEYKSFINQCEYLFIVAKVLEMFFNFCLNIFYMLN